MQGIGQKVVDFIENLKQPLALVNIQSKTYQIVVNI